MAGWAHVTLRVDVKGVVTRPGRQHLSPSPHRGRGQRFVDFATSSEHATLAMRGRKRPDRHVQRPVLSLSDSPEFSFGFHVFRAISRSAYEKTKPVYELASIASSA